MWLASTRFIRLQARLSSRDANPLPWRRAATTPARPSSRASGSSPTSSPPRPPSTKATAGSCLVASRHHLELVNAVVAAALDQAGTELAGVDAVAVTQGPGLIGALLVEGSAPPRRWPAHEKPLILSITCTGTPTSLNPALSRTALPLPDREVEGTPCWPASTTIAAPSPRPDARRRCGRGLRQGCAAARPRLPGWPAIQTAAEDGDPEAFDFPVAMTRDPGLDLSFSGLKTALVYKVRDLGPGGPSRPAPTWRRPSSERSSTSSSPRSAALWTRATGRRLRSVAGSPPAPAPGAGSGEALRAAGPPAQARAAGALYPTRP